MRDLKHTITTVLTAVAAVLVLTGCSKEQWRKAQGSIWGTTYTITYYSDRDLGDSIVAEMSRVDKELSIFNPESNVSLINANKTDLLSPMTSEIFQESRNINKITDGMFDPTIGPLSELWGFGSTKRGPGQAVDSAAVQECLGAVGIDECTVSAKTLRIVKKREDTRFDFGAIAKGYGVDCVANVLKRNKVTNYMVEVGGEMAMSGHNPSGKEWYVQIDSPESGTSEHVALTRVHLTDCCVATSGNYRNTRTLADGQRVGHTISPVTGYPVQTDVLSATIVAKQCVIADALATACMTMNSDAALRMLAGSPCLSALLQVSRPGGRIETVTYGPAFAAK
ncbi:MAG: FAD:protein FMN transferase [Bacteroidales bacterium]|nr:FAD:protein FMN transferase [Bacteroidales bacterium]